MSDGWEGITQPVCDCRWDWAAGRTVEAVAKIMVRLA